MKLLFENWRGYLEEEASKEQIKDVVTDVLKDEGGAAGLDPIKKEVEDLDLPAGFDLKAFLKGVQGVGQHEDGDYILGDDKQIHIKKEDLEEGIAIFLEAHASGALVKCRKKGAKNWGTGGKKKKKNESLSIEDMIREEIQNVLDECWKTHERVPGTTEGEPGSCRRKGTTDENIEEKKKRKLTAKPSSETSLRDWFGRKGAKGKKKGWVDCNTCRKNKKTGRKTCKACGRSSGEKRAKYPSCRPTPGACGKRGKHGKKSKAGKKG